VYRLVKTLCLIDSKGTALGTEEHRRVRQMSLSLDAVEKRLGMNPTVKCPQDDLLVSMQNNP
jgi:hypothetical protein